jgi:hypothetical protein
MRRNLLTGLLLAAAAVLVVALSATFDLELESVALLGAALGAVVALVPDRGPVAKLAGFTGGFLIAWVGYVARAMYLPDASSGRAVAVGLVVVACTVLAVASVERLPLWSILLGAGAFAGAYEFTYNAAPPELLETSVSTATTMLLTVGIGFLAASVVAPIAGAGAPVASAPPRETAPEQSARLDEIMEPVQ